MNYFLFVLNHAMLSQRITPQKRLMALFRGQKCSNTDPDQPEIVELPFSSSSSSSSSSSNLFQSQRSLKSQLKQKQSMLTIIFTGNRKKRSDQCSLQVYFSPYE